MVASIEISMYPLADDKYKLKIFDFIKRIKKNKNIRVEVNGMSTQLFGEYDLLMELLKTEMKFEFESGKVMFLLKIGGTEMTKDSLPKDLK